MILLSHGIKKYETAKNSIQGGGDPALNENVVDLMFRLLKIDNKSLETPSGAKLRVQPS